MSCEVSVVFWIAVGAAGASLLYGIARAARWVINDTNSYYEQCRIDAIDAEYERKGLCIDCGKANDRRDVSWDEMPQVCSHCL